MPSRVIRGEINRSSSMARVSPWARLTFRALLNAVDDYGRLNAEPDLLKADLHPLENDITAEMVERNVAELAADGCVVLYEVEGRPYLALPNWEKHRAGGRRSAQSKYPEPPATTGKTEIRPGNPRKSEESPGDPSEGRVARDVGRRTCSEGREKEPPRAPRSAVGRTPPPDSLAPKDQARLDAWALEHGHSPAQVARATETVLDWARSNAKTKADWVATIRNAMRDGWALTSTNSPPPRPSETPFEPFPEQPDRTSEEEAELQARIILRRRDGLHDPTAEQVRMEVEVLREGGLTPVPSEVAGDG